MSAAASACPVCGAAELPLLFPSVEPGFDVVRCATCGFGMTWPPLPAAEMARWYPPSYYGTRNVRFNKFFERLTRWFRRRRAVEITRRTAPGPAIDVGCGRGFTLRYLRDAGYQAMGFELSETAAVHARETLGVDVRTTDFLAEPLPVRTFKAIVFWHSLEHFADPFAALDRTRELLEPGGLVVIAVPNVESPQARFAGPDWFHLDIPRHYVHFGELSLRRALRDRGFRVADVAHFNLEQNPYGWIQSILNRMGFPFNLLYSILKAEGARSVRIRERPLASLASFLLGVLLLPVALALTLLETALRRGGTIEVYAVKE